MTAKEMHIQFSLGLQKLGANSRRKFEKEETDAILNTVQDQFVLDQIKVTEDEHGFLSTQVDVDKIRPLIVEKEMPVYFVNGLYEAALPSDYAHLISDVWHTARDCYKTADTAETEYIFTLPFPKTTKVGAPFYSVLQLSYNSENIVDLVLHTRQGTSTNLYTGYKGIEDHFAVLPLLLSIFHERFRNGNIASSIKGLYYEKYKSYHYPGQLILVTSSSQTTAITIDAQAYSSSLVSAAMTRHNASTYNQVPGRLVKSSVLHNLLSTPFYGPTSKSPISSLAGTKLTVHAHKSYIVNKASLTYVRTASRIDVGLQRNCELAQEFHRTIVDKAVEFAAGRLEQQALYQVAAAENIRNK